MFWFRRSPQGIDGPIAIEVNTRDPVRAEALRLAFGEVAAAKPDFFLPSLFGCGRPVFGGRRGMYVQQWLKKPMHAGIAALSFPLFLFLVGWRGRIVGLGMARRVCTGHTPAMRRGRRDGDESRVVSGKALRIKVAPTACAAFDHSPVLG